MPEEAMAILDAGRTYNGGHPPDSIRYGNLEVPNFRKDQPAQTILGAEQKAWFLERLRTSTATWKIWGNTTATLDMRADPQNLPAGLTKPWPGEGYAGFGGGDHGSAYVERGEIYDFVRDHGITGFATVAGDRHSFWAGLSAKALPPQPFQPVGVAFVTGSISAPGIGRGLRAQIPQRTSASIPLRRPRAGGPRSPADHQYAAAPWSALVPGVREKRRHREGASVVQPGSFATSFIRRYGRPRLHDGTREQ